MQNLKRGLEMQRVVRSKKTLQLSSNSISNADCVERKAWHVDRAASERNELGDHVKVNVFTKVNMFAKQSL